MIAVEEMKAPSGTKGIKPYILFHFIKTRFIIHRMTD